MKTIWSLVCLLPAMLVLTLIAYQQQPANAASSKSYTVTANLYVPGKLNTQLPGITAYLTNGSNPLGLGGYEAVAPTKPVSNNAMLTVAPDGTVTLDMHIPNPVFTLQKISGSSNATIVDSVRDDETYATLDDSVSRKGRITNISVQLLDQSGTYVFTDCIEFPTLLGLDWTVPLTLEVDLSGVDFTVNEPTAAETPNKTPVQSRPPTAAASPEPTVQPVSTKSPSQGEATGASPTSTHSPQGGAVNYDQLIAVIRTVDNALANTIISKDGSDVAAANVWVTQAAADRLQLAKKTAEVSLSAEQQSSIDTATETLTAAYAAFIGLQKAGTMLAAEEDAVPERELAAGTYQVSANIWFNKADTGLPLNPHITNSTFPPYNPVENNAVLVIAEDGSAKLTIPVVIQDKVLTVRSLSGLELLETKTNEDGSISEMTVNLGALSGSKTVVAEKLLVDIEMGNLAMSISGLDREHTWPAAFELNLSGVATKDGGVMPTVPLTLMNASEAGNAMAAATSGAEHDEGEEQAQALESGKQTDDQVKSATATWILMIALVIVLAAIVAIILIKIRNHNRRK